MLLGSTDNRWAIVMVILLFVFIHVIHQLDSIRQLIDPATIARAFLRSGFVFGRFSGGYILGSLSCSGAR